MTLVPQSRRFTASVVLILVLFAGAPGIAQDGARQAAAASGTSRGSSGAPASAGYAPGDPLTLQEAIAIALRNNPGIRAGGYRVNAATSRLDETRAGRWPSLRASGSLTRYSLDQRLFPPSRSGEPLIFTDEILGGAVALDLPLFTGGRLSGQIDAARLSAEASRHQMERNKEEVSFQVAEVFNNILRDKEDVASLEFSRDVLQKHVEIAEQLVQARKAAQVDVLRAKVRLAGVTQELTRTRNRLRIHKGLLGVLLGLQDLAPELEVSGDLTLEPTPDDLDDAVQAALSRRPDYQALRSELAAQRSRVSVARAGRWPSLSLEASYGALRALGSYDVPEGAEEWRDKGALGLRLDLPLFEGGRISARVAEESAKLAELEERISGLENTIRFQVQSARADLESARSQAEAIEVVIAQARETLRIQTEKYSQAMGSMTDVLDAQLALREAENALNRALADYNIALADLQLATGGGE